MFINIPIFHKHMFSIFLCICVHKTEMETSVNSQAIQIRDAMQIKDDKSNHSHPNIPPLPPLPALPPLPPLPPLLPLPKLITTNQNNIIKTEPQYTQSQYTQSQYTQIKVEPIMDLYDFTWHGSDDDFMMNQCSHDCIFCNNGNNSILQQSLVCALHCAVNVDLYENLNIYHVYNVSISSLHDENNTLFAVNLT